MRRLLIWLALLLGCAVLLLISTRALTNTACLQLLSPTTGDLLTLDISTGSVLLDARSAFPLPLVRSMYLDRISPDGHHLVKAVNVSESGPSAYKLWLGRRSTTYRRDLTRQSVADRYTWSPDSKHLAFTQLRGWGTQGMLIDFVITDADAHAITHENIPESLDDSWLNNNLEISWSPDGTTAVIALYRSNIGATLALRPATTAQSIFVSLPNEQIAYLSWSPATQDAYVFTQTMSDSHYNLYVVGRDGHILHHTALAADFVPNFVLYELLSAPGLRWSPDGRYFYLFGGTTNKPSLAVFDLDGNQVAAPPLSSPMTTWWAMRPHTLIYVQADQSTASQSLLTLDLATLQTATLLGNFPIDHRVSPAPDSSAFLLSERKDADHIVPHLISRDLTKNEMPFGTLLSRDDRPVYWSPDSQKVLLVTEHDDKFSLLWQVIPTGEIKHFDFPNAKQTNVDGGIYPWWLSDNLIGITTISNVVDERTLFALDAASLQLSKLSTTSTNNSSSLAWYDTGYVAVNNLANLTLYRLSDGTAIFSNLPPARGVVTFAVEPQERALLLYSARDDSVAHPTLSLITPTSNTILSNAENLTSAAWSPDGENFAFTSIEDYTRGWTIKIMSRDGNLLREIPLPAETGRDPYQQLRWTNCE